MRLSFPKYWVCLAVVVLSCATTWLSACSSDECDTDEQRCANASLAQTCQAVGGSECKDFDFFCKGPSMRWGTKSQCPSSTACLMAGSEAVCSYTPEPSPLCAAGGFICIQNDLVECKSGYPTAVFSCGDQATCKQVMSGSTNCAYCASDGVFNATCALGAAAACVNNAIYECICSDLYHLSETCGSGQSCVTAQLPGTTGPSYLDTFCALSSQPDPKCPNTRNGYYCASNVLVACTNGYAVESTSGVSCQ